MTNCEYCPTKSSERIERKCLIIMSVLCGISLILNIILIMVMVNGIK